MPLITLHLLKEGIALTSKYFFGLQPFRGDLIAEKMYCKAAKMVIKSALHLYQAVRTCGIALIATSRGSSTTQFESRAETMQLRK